MVDSYSVGGCEAMQRVWGVHKFEVVSEDIEFAFGIFCLHDHETLHLDIWDIIL